MEFNENLAAIMAERGLTQTDLARKIGSTQGTVGKWVRGDMMPTIASAIEVANALDCSMDMLCGLKPERDAAFDSAIYTRLTETSCKKLHDMDEGTLGLIEALLSRI